jgi:cobalt-zinc-cadmium efflux system membrane fusion protein
MFMNADIELARHRSIAVREEAITEFEDKNYIFLKTEQNTFTMREVKVGAREHGLVEILDGNSLSKAPIAIGGAYSLLMAIKNIE